MDKIKENLPKASTPFVLNTAFVMVEESPPQLPPEEEVLEFLTEIVKDHYANEKEKELYTMDVLSVRDFPYTKGQVEALRGIAEHYKDWTRNGHTQVFLLLNGYAGVGKTSIVETIVKYIKLFPVKDSLVQLLAPTNRAVTVMRKKVGEDTSASTLHKFVYPPPEIDKETKKTVWRVDADTMKIENRVLFIDEYSMINLELFEAIKSRIVNCFVVFIGDPFQLEQIGKAAKIEEEVKASWLLTEVKRTDNTILDLATEIRSRNLNVAYHQSTNDIILIKRNQAIEIAALAFDKTSELYNPNFLVVCATNKTRLEMTYHIRDSIFGEKCLPLYESEPVICINNNDNCVNGDIFKIEKLEILQYVIFQTFDAEYKVILCRINDIPTIFIPSTDKPSISVYSLNSSQLNKVIEKEFRELFLEVISTSSVIEPRYLNQFNKYVAIMTYGYVASAHKLQGSEMDTILLYQDYCNENWSSPRWFYTALTRASNKVYLILSKYQSLIQYNPKTNEAQEKKEKKRTIKLLPSTDLPANG